MPRVNVAAPRSPRKLGPEVRGYNPRASASPPGHHDDPQVIKEARRSP